MKLAPFAASVIACGWLLIAANPSVQSENPVSFPEVTAVQNQAKEEVLTQVSDSTEFIEIKPCENSEEENRAFPDQ